MRTLAFAGRVLGRPGAVEKRFLWSKGPLQVVLGLLTASLAELVFAPSRRTADEIERDYHVRDVRVLPNVTGGLEIAAPADADGASADGGEEIEPGYLLFVGRLRIRKGVEVLLEALAELAGDQSPARLLIAGTGEQDAALRRRVEELGLAAAVRFLGRCDAARVRRLLARARCLVVPSTYEGMPLVILEAMSESVPVVASSVSGIPEVVLDGETAAPGGGAARGARRPRGGGAARRGGTPAGGGGVHAAGRGAAMDRHGVRVGFVARRLGVDCALLRFARLTPTVTPRL